VIWLAIIPAALLAAYLLWSCGPELWTRRDRGGDARKGLVLFVEPVRFPGWLWGARTVPAALRAAGFKGEFLYWRWQRPIDGLLVLPALRGRRRIEVAAQQIAEHITAFRRDHGGAAVHLLGYSCGGFVALRALELLPPGAGVTSAALLAPAFSPRRDLSVALDRVEDKLVVASSPMDWFICGLGTAVCGGGDGVHGPAAALRGARGVDGRLLAHRKLVQLRWRCGMIRRGLLGMHAWAMSRAFLTHRLAGVLGIGPAAASSA